MYAFDIGTTVTTPQTLGVSQTGRIRAAGMLDVQTNDPAVALGADAVLYVNGVVQQINQPAIRGEGSGITVDIRETGFVHSLYVFGLNLNNVIDFSIANAGTLSGGEAGVFMSAASTGRIDNAGLITGRVAINVFGQSGETLTIVNSGLIEGAEIGVKVEIGALNLTNRGTIKTASGAADALALRGSYENDVVINEGRITGRTEFLDGENVFDGREGVQGAVQGGVGDDTIYGGLRADEIYGGSGGEDRLYGSAGRDVIYAGPGDGDRRLYGGSDSDKLYGGGGADMLLGHSGNDVLVAGVGGDSLYGGFNGDRLIAGAGRDALNGGDGSDRFVFTTSATAGRGSTRDVIEDFAPGRDLLDVSAIAGKYTFDYIGAALFSDARWELRYDRETGLVQGDTTGNGQANFQIEIESSPRLDADDFGL